MDWDRLITIEQMEAATNELLAVRVPELVKKTF